MRIYHIFTLLFISYFSYSQSYFTNISENDVSLRSDQERTIIPDEYQLVALDIEALKDYMLMAPEEMDQNRSDMELQLQIPMPDGKSKTFLMYHSPTMEPGISARYPQIKSYKGYGRANAYENIRISVNQKGFYAAIRTVDGTVYIDPYATGDDTKYMSYFVSDHHPDLQSHQLACGTNADENAIIEGLSDINPQGGQITDITLRGDNVPLRQYRLAIACTGEWGQIRNGIDDILADINTTVTRLNMIFENELSIRMILIDRNDEIVYEDPTTDPYNIPTSFPDNDGSGRFLLRNNTSVLNQKLGDNTYDLGHIYHRACTDVGGVAYLGSICSEIKGGGVTCHASGNLEYVTVSIAAHEMGHQLGSPHSFNNCGGNESIATGFEPGSGTTIMSYAGLCGTNNVQGFNDDYYQVGSLINMYGTTRDGNGATCAEEIDIQNHAPDIVLDYPSNMYIPISTPFILTGSATDEDGDIMTYNWDQTNSGPISPLGSPSNNSPSFRSFYPDENPTRIFPAANKVLAFFSEKSEVLPTYNRDLTFQFVTRDNNPGGGTATWEEVAFRATQDAGPFLVTYPDNNVTGLDIGQEIDVEWDVAGTDITPVNCDKVDIYMSYGGELNTDKPSEDLILLAQNVANDGSHPVVIPNKEDFQSRIVVRGSNHIFFNVNRNNLNITDSGVEAIYFDLSDLSVDLCSDEKTINLSSVGLGGFDGDFRIELEGLPNEATTTIENENLTAGENTDITFDLTNLTTSGSYEVTIRAIIDGIDTLTRVIPVSNIATDFSDLSYIGPNDGVIGGTSLPTFSWTEASNADYYTFELATNPAFDQSSLVITTQVTSETYTPTVLLNTSTIYYWRVRAENQCRVGDYPEVYGFSTESLTCDTYTADNLPINISQSGIISIEAEIPVLANGSIADANVARIKGSHERNKDLTAYLVSPAGTEIKLFGNKCSNQSNFDCGFDDESPNDFSCPLNAQITYKSEQDLATLNGEDINGTWILRMEDNNVGNGGRLENVILELCSNLSLDPPVLVNLSQLETPPASRQIIKVPNLLTTDANNSPNELLYTLVQAPTHGELQLFGTKIEVGGQWSQQDINTDGIKYLHYGDGSDTDDFRFDVQDGDGGWVEITQFDIVIDESFVTSTADAAFDNAIEMYPNPASQNIIISYDKIDDLHAKILDVSGRTLLQQNLNNSNTINITSLQSGIYLVEFTSGERQSVKKLIIQK